MGAARFVVLASVLLVAGCVALAATSGRVAVRDDGGGGSIGFSTRQRALIDAYYRNAPGNVSSRRASRADNAAAGGLARHRRIPPDLRREPLPRDLEQRLGPPPSGYLRARIGPDIVLYNGHTRIVIDIVYDVGR